MLHGSLLLTFLRSGHPPRSVSHYRPILRALEGYIYCSRSRKSHVSHGYSFTFEKSMVHLGKSPSLDRTRRHVLAKVAESYWQVP